MVNTVPNNIASKQYMTPDQFCFWLQGLFELCPDLKTLTEAQVKMIRDHLNYVFEGKSLPIQSSPVSSAVPYYPGTTVTTYPYYPGASGTSGLAGVGHLTGAEYPLTTVC